MKPQTRRSIGAFEIKAPSEDNLSLERAYDIAREHSTNPADAIFLSREPGLDLYLHPTESYLAVVTIGRCAMILGGIVGSPASRPEVLDDFMQNMAQSRHDKVAAARVHGDQVGLFGEAGFKVQQVGTSYELRADDFSLTGSEKSRIRKRIRRAEKSGLVVDIKPLSQITDTDSRQLDEVDAHWLEQKNTDKKVRYIVGDRSKCAQDKVMIATAKRDDEIRGYHMLQPAFARGGGWVADSTRAHRDDGISELLVTKVIDSISSDDPSSLSGSRYYFGNIPFHRIESMYNTEAYSTRMGTKIVGMMAKYPGLFYAPAPGLVAYKEKWGADVYPEYFCYKAPLRMSHINAARAIMNSAPITSVLAAIARDQYAKIRTDQPQA